MAVDYKKELQILIQTVITERASDLHLSVDIHPTLRVNSALIPLVKKPILTSVDVLGFAEVMMRPEFIERLNRRVEVDFSYENAEGARFRGNTFYQKGKLAIALRLIPNVIM